MYVCLYGMLFTHPDHLPAWPRPELPLRRSSLPTRHLQGLSHPFYMWFMNSILLSVTASYVLIDAFAAPSAQKLHRRSSSSSSIVYTPPPAWWKPYSPYSGRYVAQIFNGNNVSPDRLHDFKARLNALEMARQCVIQLTTPSPLLSCGDRSDH